MAIKIIKNVSGESEMSAGSEKCVFTVSGDKTLIVKVSAVHLRRPLNVAVADVTYSGDFTGCSAYSFKHIDGVDIVKEAYDHLMSLDEFNCAVKV